jgi:hypothetical protein
MEVGSGLPVGEVWTSERSSLKSSGTSKAGSAFCCWRMALMRAVLDSGTVRPSSISASWPWMGVCDAGFIGTAEEALGGVVGLVFCETTSQNRDVGHRRAAVVGGSARLGRLCWPTLAATCAAKMGHPARAASRSFGYVWRMKPRQTPLRMTIPGRQGRQFWGEFDAASAAAIWEYSLQREDDGAVFGDGYGVLEVGAGGLAVGEHLDLG